MKIHYLATSNIPSKTANSLQISKMCDAFSNIGHKISLIVPNFKNINVSIKEYYDLKNNFKIYKVGSKINNIKGINNILIPIKILKKSFHLGCDIILTRNLVISLILILFKKKHIFEIHDDLASSGNLLSKIYKIFNLLNSKSIVKLIFISNNLKKFISEKYNYNKNNFDILPDATDLINKRKIIKKKIGRKKIGYFGSIYSSRGIPLIIKLSQIDKKNIYFIYGGSKAEISKILKHKSKNLVIHPQISYKKVKKKIMQMDVLLMPYTKLATFSGNYGNIINFMSPMKMFDYMGAGKIIVSSNIKVLREILKNDFNSLLIKKYLNVNEWKKKIDMIKLEKNKFVKLRLNALKTAQKFTWDNRAKKMIRFTR
tara:strand:- start:521 stop:1633 length:1113 start_codon:yes stop_codon:yes gene_type:complete